MDNQFDIAIVGAGAVGGSLAYALSRAGFSIALIEKTAVSAHQQPAFDERHYGFSRSTAVAFDGIGLWQELCSSAVAISRIHVSSRGQFGSVMMDAQDEGLDSLGYVLPAREIGRVLHEKIAAQQNIRLFAPADVAGATVTGGKAQIELAIDNSQVQLDVDLLIGADGAESRVRELFDIGTSRWTYGESAVIANIDVSGLDTTLAFERFIGDGALALLPRNGDGYAVVCSVADDVADNLMSMGDDAFADYIAAQMGSHISGIQKVGQRFRFPLVLVRSQQSVRDHLVLIGNAAHYIHPVAAQGFNLSMRDVAALVETLVEARNKGLDIGTLSVLQSYADWRRQDERIMVAFTDSLIRLFTNPLLPVAVLRQKGMMLLRHCSPLRSLFTRAVTGRVGRQSALMRGLELP